MSLWSDPWEQDPSAARPAPPAARVWKVNELTREIRARLEHLGRLSVEGEVVGLKRASSGHLYFSLKDIDARIDCTIWRGALQNAVKFDLREGQQVVAHGKLDVYAPRGSYSLNVTRLEPAGTGTLLARLEELKQRLKAEGWFDRRRPLPAFPRLVGVVTSRDTAAFQDFLRTRSQRWPLYPVRFAHASVQGAGAAREIAAAIDRLDASGVDVICVVRGGGSLEDLWAFNELPVLEAIRRARVPVVSGIGHETDVTLSDLVADHRAHTPTDAAQAVLPDRRALLDAVDRARRHLARAMDAVLETRAQRLERAARLAAGMTARLDRAEARVARVATRLAAQAPHARLERIHAQLERSAPRLRLAVDRALEGRRQRVDLAARALHACSPFAVLERGYTITRRAQDRQPLAGAAGLAAGDVVETVFARGSALSRVEQVDPGARSEA